MDRNGASLGLVARGYAQQLSRDGGLLDEGLIPAASCAFQHIRAHRGQRLIAGLSRLKIHPNHYTAGPGPSRFHGGFVGQESVAVTRNPNQNIR